MASQKDKVPIDVTWEDQRSICEFGRKHARHLQLNAMIKAKNKNLEDISDATDEVYISDEIRFVFGESFVTVDANDAEELLNNKKEKEEADLSDLTAEFEALNKSMTELKANLYAKFGSQIYLENE